MRPQDRERICVEVVSRVVETAVRKASDAPAGALEDLIHDTLYHERRRLEHDHSKVGLAQQRYYDEVQRRLGTSSAQGQRDILQELAERFVDEVVGNFDERVYRFSTSAIPVGLWALLRASSPMRLLGGLWGTHRGLSEHLRVEGEVDHARALAQRGTVIVVPTHSSNLDSILVGYSAYLIGLPPLTYGAGLNLFTNPVLSFFMRNLGAYRVDRKKKCRLYKHILKEYATCSMEMGYHNLFFPGGTRSRSGAIEQHLKMGLLGTAVSAYVHNLREGKARPNFYVLPCTISSKLVLEAETLIDDHLKEQGRSRFIIDDDEFSRPKVILDFLSKFVSLDSRIVLTYGRPMDIFGNLVDRQGRSLDRRGREVDPESYVLCDGEPREVPQRDRQYTRELAQEIARAYLRDNVIMSTNLVAAALFRLLRARNPDMDLFRLVRTGGDQASFPMSELHDEVGRLRDVLRDRKGGPRLSELVRGGEVPDIVADALKLFGIFHKKPAAVRRGDRVFHEQCRLLLFYGNRLKGYGLGPEEGGLGNA